MFERFSKAARAAVAQAHDEARRVRAQSVGPEHIFLALAGQPDAVAGRVVSRHGTTLDAARAEVESVAPPGTRSVPGDLGFSSTAKALLKSALEEARGLDHRYIGTEHLLLAMFRVSESPMPELLRHFDLKAEPVRASVLRELAVGRRRGRAGQAAEADAPRNNVVMCRVSDADLKAIDALVEAGVCATRSDAAAWLIRAGVAGRTSMFESLQGTVSEIRRLREQAQMLASYCEASSSAGGAGATTEAETPEPPPTSADR